MSFPCFQMREILTDADGSVYVPGLIYTASNDRLIRKAEAWVVDGKAEWMTPGNPMKVGGHGIVK